MTTPRDDEKEWDPDHSFSTPDYNRPRDYLTAEEWKKIRRAALDWRELPYYQNHTPDERGAMNPYIANEWTNLDASLRLTEVKRATTDWVDTENAVFRIPHEESLKNSEN